VYRSTQETVFDESFDGVTGSRIPVSIGRSVYLVLGSAFLHLLPGLLSGIAASFSTNIVLQNQGTTRRPMQIRQCWIMFGN
jgi:hypothetical protein